jgi:hypothetical protein
LGCGFEEPVDGDFVGHGDLSMVTGVVVGAALAAIECRYRGEAWGCPTPLASIFFYRG